MQIEITKKNLKNNFIMPLICINNLSFGYESNLVLDKINLDIEACEYIGIVGPNGGGKTTLIKLILGILKDKSKEVQIRMIPILMKLKLGII